ncbi:MAG: enoyl-CoA hydratase/isomerase family protein [Acidimicrobiales bacterium]
MATGLTPAQLLSVTADGLDDTALSAMATAPAVLVNLDQPFVLRDLQRLLTVVEAAPVLLIGIADFATENAAVLGLDLLLCRSPDAPAPWIACGESFEQKIEELLLSIGGSPDAAIALAQLLRVGATASASEAIVAESWVYSLLQGGDRYARWLEDQSDRVVRPRPENPIVRLKRIDDELKVCLNRPDVHNAYGTRMRDELVEAFRLADSDQTITRVELRGEGPSFCSGGDLDEFGTAPTPVEAHEVRTRRNAGVALIAIADRVEVFVHGRCVGAGVELPAFAARVVAHSETTFLLPEISMGLVPGAGGTSSIPRRIGRHRCAYFALCGSPIDAPTALNWGLIDAIDDTKF